MRTRTQRCHPRLPSPACALCSRGVCAGLARCHHAGELCIRRLWRALASSGARDMDARCVAHGDDFAFTGYDEDL
eukprot:10840006-Alexandrium_andersonii.AAC.1